VIDWMKMKRTREEKKEKGRRGKGEWRKEW
jgi:hypothetical protein